jgi:glyoxylate/hydroxypyruvate reductase A
MALHLIVPAGREHLWRLQFEKIAPDLPINTAAGNEDRVKYAFVWLPPPGALAKFENLKVIFSMGAGVDHVFNDPDLPNVPIVRVVDDNLTMRMIEWVMMNVLLHHRQFRTYDSQQSRAEWLEVEQPGADEVRVGIMGLGAIGKASAIALRDLGFQVAGWSNSRKAIAGVESFAREGEKTAFLNRSDILVNLLPLTPQTKGLIDAKLIGDLPQDGALSGPVIINGGRGGSQVEADIIACLDNGSLAGASLDVFETEPLSSDSPLWARRNVYITPHVAAVSDPIAITTYVARQIARFEKGMALQNIVDPQLRY